MDAIKGNINSILNGYKQFIIPVYQRTYSWERTQCKKLWDDIVEMQKSNRLGHFVGSIVNIAEQAMPTGVQKFMIIDGQQRMTTLTLLLIALRNYLEENPDASSINPRSINGMCIQNDYGEGDERYKLLLTHKDKDVLVALIEKLPTDQHYPSRILDAYDFFADQIRKRALTPEEIQEGIAKLQIVNITLDRAVDDPQLIFESLNSTGMDLTQSDLIRNFLLMGLEPNKQNQIYKNYWLPLERLFSAKQSSLMDQFFRDYLTLKSHKIPKVNEVYDEFKSHRKNRFKGLIEDFCADLYKHAKYYTEMYFAKSDDKELNLIFSDIRALRMEVAYPFLLRVYLDYAQGCISKDSLIEILKYCESYVFRRAISGIPTNSLNKTFAVMLNNIREDDYVNSVKAYFGLLDTYKVYPTDHMFRIDFAVKDIYNMRIRNYVLSKLENHKNKAKINAEDYTIEHIMPQNKNLSKEWRDALGSTWQEVQKEYLHCIGNLTLTAYNAEMSDRTFSEKLEMAGGFKESALRLNSYVVRQTTWNAEKIKERSNELFQLALEIWPYPELYEATLERYLPEEKSDHEYTLEDYAYLSGRMLSLYQLLDNRIMNISSGIKREYKKLYIAYKADTNFVDIIPQKTRLRLAINMKFNEVIDPKGICLDVTNKRGWGNGAVEAILEYEHEIDDVMDIINQSYNKQVEI